MKPGFAVRILEEPELSESAKREQSEATQREKDDLVAQQLAAESAYRNLWIALSQTIIAVFGTVALIYSLYLNRKATRAAESAVKVTEKAVALAEAANEATAKSNAIAVHNARIDQRAWVILEIVSIGPVRRQKDRQIQVRVNVIAKNTGKTPATGLCFNMAIFSLFDNRKEVASEFVSETIKMRNGGAFDGGSLGPGEERPFYIDRTVREDQLVGVDRTAEVRYHFKAVFGVVYKTIIPDMECFSFKSVGIADKGQTGFPSTPEPFDSGPVDHWGLDNQMR